MKNGLEGHLWYVNQSVGRPEKRFLPQTSIKLADRVPSIR